MSSGLVRGLVSPVRVSTNPSKWVNLCDNLIDVLQVGEVHQNGKGRNFPVPALHREGMEMKGNPKETQGASCAGQAAGGSATPALLLLLFTAGLGHRNMGQGCAGTCSQAALCHSCANLSRLTLMEGSDSAVTSGQWPCGRRAGHGVCTHGSKRRICPTFLFFIQQ